MKTGTKNRKKTKREHGLKCSLCGHVLKESNNDGYLYIKGTFSIHDCFDGDHTIPDVLIFCVTCQINVEIKTIAQIVKCERDKLKREAALEALDDDLPAF